MMVSVVMVMVFMVPTLMTVMMVIAGPPRGRGEIAPGPQNRGPLENFCWPDQSLFFWVKYFRAKGKIFVFLVKVPKFGMKN